MSGSAKLPGGYAMSRLQGASIAAACVLVPSIAVYGILWGTLYSPSARKHDREFAEKWERLELVKTCNRVWVYRDRPTGRLLAVQSALSQSWFAPDVTIDKACSEAGAS